MSFNRRFNRDRGGGRDRPPRDRDRDGPRDRPQRDRAYEGPRDRPPRDRAFESPRDRPPRDRAYESPQVDRPRRPRQDWRGTGAGGGPGRGDRYGDEGGMSIRLDPRRLSALKQLAGDAGLRPGELVTRWVEERVDAERGGAGGTPPLQAPRTAGPDLGSVLGRLEELSARVAALEAGSTGGPEVQTPVEEAAPVAEVEAPAVAEPRRRGRPRQQPEESPAPKRVPLHEEIAAVIEERGPSTAAEIADAIAARGRYAPPRSGKPLDSATVNSRVSNPVYRSRFVRREGRIGLAEPAA